MNQHLAKLTHHFRQQQQFSNDYSPLYAALFGTIADWLTNLPQDPAVEWLLEATRNRAAFDSTNLLAAGLHYEVLRRSDQVSALSLPDDLPAFLNRQQSTLQKPLLIYNTYIKIYLPDRGEKLRSLILEWAARQNRPVVWIQWEPPNYLSLQSDIEPQLGWLAWTADIWHKGEHHHYQLGWVHPHGHQVQWLRGIEAWIAYWSSSVNSTDIN